MVRAFFFLAGLAVLAAGPLSAGPFVPPHALVSSSNAIVIASLK